MRFVFYLITGSSKSSSQPQQWEVLCSLWHSTSGNIGLGLLKWRSIITVSWVRQLPVTSHRVLKTSQNKAAVELLPRCQPDWNIRTFGSPAREPLLELPLGAPHFTVCVFLNVYCLQQTAVSPDVWAAFTSVSVCFRPETRLNSSCGQLQTAKLCLWINYGVRKMNESSDQVVRN